MEAATILRSPVVAVTASADPARSDCADSPLEAVSTLLLALMSFSFSVVSDTCQWDRALGKGERSRLP